MKAILYFQILSLCLLFTLNLPVITQTTVEDSTYQISEKDLIHRGDLIDVDIIGSSEFDWRGTLTAEGNLAGLDFIESPVYALCKTTEEVEKSVALAYSNLLREPKAKVSILDRSNRPLAAIYGAIKSEQRFQIKRSVNLNELIVLSGGFTDKSSGIVEIFRPAGLSCGSLENIKLGTGEEREKFVRASKIEGSVTLSYTVTDLLSGKNNPEILSGDVITVLSANPIYVIGGVKNPKSISSREKMTLSRSIASAGGFSKDAETSSIIIFRQNGSLTDVIEADYEKMKADGEGDFFLQEFDIVEVGVKGRKKNKFPPVIEKSNASSQKKTTLPMRVID